MQIPGTAVTLMLFLLFGASVIISLPVPLPTERTLPQMMAGVFLAILHLSGVCRALRVRM